AALLPKQRTTPLLWFGCFSNAEHKTGKAAAEFVTALASGRGYAGPLSFGLSESDYAARFAKAKDYIFAGDVYQSNLTFPASFHFLGDPFALYARLRPRGLAGYGGIVCEGERHHLSFSPELFFEIADGTLTSRPMKGTAPRGSNAEEDSLAKKRLSESEKDR